MKLNTEHLDRCLESLAFALDAFTENKHGPEMRRAMRSAATKEFEVAMEFCFKLLRKAIVQFQPSPAKAYKMTFREVFRAAAQHGLIAEEELEAWLQFRDNRNRAAHEYGEAFAEETVLLAPQFLVYAKRLQKGINTIGNKNPHS